MTFRRISCLLAAGLLCVNAGFAAGGAASSMGKPPKVQWDISRLTEQDLAGGPATVRFKTDQDVDDVTIRATPSLLKELDVQPSGYSGVVAGTWYDVTVDVIGGGAPTTTVGGTIQIRGDKGVLAKPLNVSIKVNTGTGSTPPGGTTPGGTTPTPTPSTEVPTIAWNPPVIDFDSFAGGQNVMVDFTVERDLGKVCVWLTPSVANDMTVTPMVFDPLLAADAMGAPITHTLDIQLNGLVTDLTSNLGGTLHLRDCSSGDLKRTYDEPLPIDIVVNAANADPVAAPAVVVSSAGFTQGAVAPNQIVSIFGEGIGPQNLAAFSLENGAVGTNLGQTTVLFDGVPAPLLATQFGQVNAIVPGAASGSDTVQMRVLYRGQMSEPFLLAVSPAMPAVFTVDESGQGAILNVDGSLNGIRNPARRGTIVTIFGTGGGIVDSSLADGQVLGQSVELSGDVQVTIDGVPAAILWAGAPAGTVNGVFQINLRLPYGALGAGVWPIVVSVDGIEGSSGATIAVQ